MSLSGINRLEAADFDVLNHLCLIRKLKARTVSSLKKKCQEMTKPPEEEYEYIKVINNEIYFYCDVSS